MHNALQTGFEKFQYKIAKLFYAVSNFTYIERPVKFQIFMYYMHLGFKGAKVNFERKNHAAYTKKIQ